MWHDRTAWRDDRTSTRGVALAAAVATVAQDRLTRRWPADGSGHTRLARAGRPWFGSERGALILEDTVMPHPVATAMASLAGVYARPERPPVYGVALVRRVWTTGTLRVPLGLRRGHHGGPATSVWAWARRSDARHRLRGRPASVRVEAGYPSTALLTRMRDDGWSGVGRLTTPRRVTGHAGRPPRRHPDGAERGRLRGGRHVLVVRDGATDDATHRLTRPAVEVRRPEHVRAQMEDVRRVCQNPRGLGGCHARSARAPGHHGTGCVVACGGLERAQHDPGRTIDHLKRQRSDRGQTLGLPALERLRGTASPLQLTAAHKEGVNKKPVCFHA